VGLVLRVIAVDKQSFALLFCFRLHFKIWRQVFIFSLYQLLRLDYVRITAADGRTYELIFFLLLKKFFLMKNLGSLRERAEPALTFDELIDGLFICNYVQAGNQIGRKTESRK
jgi:hypothetical protein